MSGAVVSSKGEVVNVMARWFGLVIKVEVIDIEWVAVVFWLGFRCRYS